MSNSAVYIDSIALNPAASGCLPNVSTKAEHRRSIADGLQNTPNPTGILSVDHIVNVPRGKAAVHGCHSTFNVWVHMDRMRKQNANMFIGTTVGTGKKRKKIPRGQPEIQTFALVGNDSKIAFPRRMTPRERAAVQVTPSGAGDAACITWAGAHRDAMAFGNCCRAN